ncbi:hypothetical protein H257_18800, partial [Aphanomyces astaci]
MAPRRIKFQDDYSKIHTPIWLDSTLADTLSSVNLQAATRTSKLYVSLGMVSLADFQQVLDATPTESVLENFLRRHKITSYRVSARQLRENYLSRQIGPLLRLPACPGIFVLP